MRVSCVSWDVWGHPWPRLQPALHDTAPVSPVSYPPGSICRITAWLTLEGTSRGHPVQLKQHLEHLMLHWRSTFRQLNVHPAHRLSQAVPLLLLSSTVAFLGSLFSTMRRCWVCSTIAFPESSRERPKKTPFNVFYLSRFLYLNYIHLQESTIITSWKS